MPFIQELDPDGHKLMQNNNLKHVSVYAGEWMEENKVNWWKISHESPELNLLENLCHELKSAKSYVEKVFQVDRMPTTFSSRSFSE